MSYRKRPLRTGDYTATIVHAEIRDELFELVWVIDTGEHAWRNLKEQYPLDDWGMEKLKSEMSSLGYIVVTDYTKPLFIKQFLNNPFRAVLKVERSVVGNELRNVITDRFIPLTAPEYNVKKEKDDSHFFKNKEERDLPFDITNT